MFPSFRIAPCKIAGQLTGLHKGKSITSPAATSVFKQQVASLMSMETLKITQPDYKRPDPFPYWKKSYNAWHRTWDNTTFRFDDNSLVVCIEGPIAAGKDKFAQRFAKEFGMKYYPRFSFDKWYKSPYGFDMRDFDEQLPVSCQTTDIDKFLKNPRHVLTAAFQFRCYLLKFDQYLDGLYHTLSTGQGVVLQRSPYSDIVFMQAMYNAGYISDKAFELYNNMLAKTLYVPMKPHLVIYLDVDAKNVKEKINKRNIPYEVKSEVLTEQFLKDIENNYKGKVLKDADKYSNLAVYDWNEEGNFDYIVDELEEMNFVYAERDTRMEDWTVEDEDYFTAKRIMYSPEMRENTMAPAIIPRYDIPELMGSGNDAELLEIFENEMQPGLRYAPGYDPTLDKKIYWNWREFSEEDVRKMHSKDTTDDVK